MRCGRRRRGGRSVAVAHPRAGAQHRRVAAVGPRRRPPRCRVLGAPAGHRDPGRARAGRAARPVLVRHRRRSRRRLRSAVPTSDARVSDESVAVVLAGHDTGVRIAPSDVVTTLVSIARRFVDVRDNTGWRVTELADATALVDGLAPSAEPGRSWPPLDPPAVGWISQDDGRIALGAAVPLGLLQARRRRVPRRHRRTDGHHAVALGAGLRPRRMGSPSRLRVLAPMGLVFDENSPWLDVSACTGSPGCAQSAADVRADAIAAAATERQRGQPALRRLRSRLRQSTRGDVLIATGDGYRVRTVMPLACGA